MLIKTLRAHSNGYGDKFLKKKGDEYIHPEPGPLLDLKYATEVSHDNDDSKDGGLQGDGGSSLPNEEIDGEEHGLALDDKEPRADKGSSEKPSAKGQRRTKKRDRDLEEGDQRQKD